MLFREMDRASSALMLHTRFSDQSNRAAFAACVTINCLLLTRRSLTSKAINTSSFLINRVILVDFINSKRITLRSRLRPSLYTLYIDG